MRILPRRLKSRKAIASALVVAVIAGVPLTIAALHPGFPVADVELNSRDVWVTNGEELLGGRLNRQIDELNGSVVAASAEFDVLQHGDVLFMHDPVSNRVESVSPASTQVTSAIDVPPGAEVDFGGSTLAILAPNGDLWTVPTAGDLQFNYVSTPPRLKLGKGSHATVTQEGVVIAVSPTKKTLYRMESLAEDTLESAFPAVGEFQLSAVGDQAVVFDQSTNEFVTQNGSVHQLDDEAFRLQQVSGPASYAVLAAADSLLKVDLGSGAVEKVSADIESPAKKATDVSAPVSLDGCVHGAWASAQRYLRACDGEKPKTADIDQPTQGGILEFRVNRSVIALNNLTNGNVWLVDDNMRLVENWDDVTPPQEQETEEVGEEKSALQSFEDTLAERSDTNRPPTAVDDDYGIRPGRTTVLSLLENDTDPDGDVLVISAFEGINESTGHLDPIDGGRALQFTPAPGFVGMIAFGYTIDDGRGGTDQARVTARVVDEKSNGLPVAIRVGGVSVEANQTVSYNVLTDWKDPDGDDLYLVGASPKSGDLVRFTPDGFVTFTHQTSELGEKEVSFLVSDGRGTPVQGTMTVQVEQTGSLNPIGTPDFASTFTNETVLISPLLNDLSPSGEQLTLLAMDEATGGAVATFSSERGVVSFSSSAAGVFYLKYTVAAGANTSVGLIRVDVLDKAAGEDLPPVAVKDVAYLRGEEPVTVSVLSNDVSPTGRILAVQSVSVPAELKAKGLVVELLESTLVRVTSPAALTEPVGFTYTISDGTKTATAGVTVVPVPALTKHQPPVALNDAARVRVGDITTLDVLSNDFHPDDSVMNLDENLVTPPTDGIAFVSKNKLRFQAPNKAGEYRVDYRVIDPFGETATATAIFTVTPLDEKNNQDPAPVPIVARVLAGGTIRVDIPLDGIDPDGDSSQLLNFPTNPTLGSVVETGPNYFMYEASGAGAGTDSFSYEVYDAFGATGVGDVKIAVIPEPDELQEPTAVPDNISVRPGRIAQVDLMANDSDPQGAPIKVSEDLIDVPEGIKAEVVKGRYLVLTAPDTEQSFSLRYRLSNDRGGSVMSYVLVQVTPDAPLLPPTADDLVITTAEIAGKKSVTVNIFDGSAFNPSGRTEDLVLSLEGPNKSSAALLEANGMIEVTPGPTRQAITYRVTNTKDELSALAFILVPAAVDEGFDDPPRIDPNLPIQYVSMNETREWNLSDILDVPSGREAWITDKATVSGVQSNGEPIYIDKDTLRFTPVTDYRGPAAINFTVTDGASANDPKANKANLRLNIVVGDPEFRDTPPDFTTPNTQVEVGEQTVLDLRASTGHPNPQILQEVSYSNLSGSTSGVKATLNGSELTITAPRNTPKGTTATLGVTLRWDKFEVQGTVNVTVVGSTRPLAVAVTDKLEMQRGGGDGASGSITVQPLANDSNPYQTTGEKLRIVEAVVQNTGEPAQVSRTSDTVTIKPSAALKSGVIEVVYTIEDATEDPDRRVNGTIILTVSDVPDQVAKPTRDPNSDIGADQSASFRFIAPATNGKPITSYEVRSSPSVGSLPNCVAGAVCTLNGLSNGTAYKLSVRAINVHGPGEWSDYSDAITPYGTPTTPVPVKTTQSKWAPSSITWQWPLVAGTGGTTSYRWTASTGATGSGVDLTTATISGVGAGSYWVKVVATNAGGKSGAEGQSANVVVVNQPAPSAPRNLTTPAGGQGASKTLTWSWTAPANATADQAGDGLVYFWTASNGASGNGAGTSASITVGPGTYTLSVYAKNSGGQSSAVTSGAVTITNPPPPVVQSAIALKRSPVSSGTCDTWSCGYPAITWSGFGQAGSTHAAGNYNICFSVGPNSTVSGCQTVNITAGGGSHVFVGGYNGWPPNTYSITVSPSGDLNRSASWQDVPNL